MVLHYSCKSSLVGKMHPFNLSGCLSLCVRATPQINSRLSSVLQTMTMTSVAQGCHQLHHWPVQEHPRSGLL